MSDLIRRQDAIRIVKGAYVKSKDIDDFYALLLTAFENILPYEQPDLSGYSDRLWETAYNRGYERCRQDAIDVAKQHWYKPDIAGSIGRIAIRRARTGVDSSIRKTARIKTKYPFHNQSRICC